MFGIATIGKFEPVIFKIGGDESEDDYFGDVSLPLTLELFCISVENSGKSWEEMRSIMTEYHNKMTGKHDGLNVHVCGKGRKLYELLKKRKHMEGIRDQLVNTVRFMENKVSHLSRETFQRMKAVKKKLEHKQLLQNIIEQVVIKNQKMQADVQELQRQLTIKLRHLALPLKTCF